MNTFIGKNFIMASADAVSDILGNTRWVGTLESIGWLTSIIDSAFATFISIVALFIISSGLLRNVVAGAYAAYPDFWDKVDQAHKAIKLNKNIVGNMKDVFNGTAEWGGEDDGSAGQSTIALFFYRLLPNFKAISEFKRGIAPRDYFIKAIPQMFGVVFLGIFIWNGYYRDFAAKAGDAGSTLVERAILDTDPVAFVDKVFGMATAPSFDSDSSGAGLGKLKSQISKDIYTKVINIYTDQTTKNQKQLLAANIEAQIDKLFREAESTNDSYQAKKDGDNSYLWSNLVNPQEFKASYKVLTKAIPEGTSPKSGYEYDLDYGSYIDNSTEYYVLNFYIADIRKDLGLQDSVKSQEQDYSIQITCQFTRINNTVKDTTKYVDRAILSVASFNKNVETTIPGIVVSSGPGKGTPATVTMTSGVTTIVVKVYSDGNALKMTTDNTIPDGTYDLKGKLVLDYQNQKVTVTKITFKKGGSVSVTDESGAAITPTASEQ